MSDEPTFGQLKRDYAGALELINRLRHERDVALADRADLLETAKELREALTAAMRVLAEIDTGTLMGLDRQERMQRFVDEVHLAGLKDGFGVRCQNVIARIDPAWGDALARAERERKGAR